ncbi:hypothetical protein [Nocardia nova]
MTTPSDRADWSPADSSAAIAVSEAYWWYCAVKLEVQRLRDDPDRRLRISSHQVDARQLIFALRQLLTAATLMKEAAEERRVTRVVMGMHQAVQRFNDALPGIKHMRDGLMHFEDWSRGRGHGPQRDRQKAGDNPREIAWHYWAFAFDSEADTVSLGPYSINITRAEQAARDLRFTIDEAGRALDQTVPR